MFNLGLVCVFITLSCVGISLKDNDMLNLIARELKGKLFCHMSDVSDNYCTLMW